MPEYLIPKVCEWLEENKSFLEAVHNLALREKVELGFAMCERNGEIFSGAQCRGEETCIEIKDCGEGNFIGTFHTHQFLSGIAEPSTLDILDAYGKDEEFICISGTYDEKIVCYHLPNEEFRSLVKNIYGKIEEYNRRARKYNEKIERYEYVERLPQDLREEGLRLEQEYKKLKEQLDGIKEIAELEEKTLVEKICETKIHVKLPIKTIPIRPIPIKPRKVPPPIFKSR